MFSRPALMWLPPGTSMYASSIPRRSISEHRSSVSVRMVQMRTVQGDAQLDAVANGVETA